MNGNGYDSDDEKYAWRGEHKSEWAKVSQVPVTQTQTPPNEEDPISKLKEELLKEKELLEEKVEVSFALDGTIDTPELLRRVTVLQNQLKIKMIKLIKAQDDHAAQVVENRTLKEYVSSLLAQSSTLGLDSKGRPVAPVRTSSMA